MIIYRLTMASATPTTSSLSVRRQEAAYPLTRVNVSKFTQEVYDPERSTTDKDGRNDYKAGDEGGSTNNPDVV
jgi:hypothetical protein